MRILQACPYSWQARGGVQAHVEHLSGELRARGHEVLVLAPGADATLRCRDVAIVGRSTAIRFNGSVAPTCLDPRTFLTVRRTIRAFGPDVVHAHEPYASTVSGFSVLHARVPVVATFHAAIDRAVDLRGYSALAGLCGFVRRRLHLRIAVSETAARTARHAIGDPMVIVPNGTRCAAPAVGRHAARSNDVILFVGRLEPRKGVRTAIEAFERLAGTHPRTELVIVGDGPDREAVERLRAPLARRVRRIASCDDRLLAALRSTAAVCIAPSTGQESFGMVLLEAMAAGVPVVASDIAGYRDLVHENVTGLLVPPGDAGALAAAIARVLDDASLARRLSGLGREEVRRFAWAHIARQLEDEYRRLLDLAGPHAPLGQLAAPGRPA